jgi:hypothetical protein
MTTRLKRRRRALFMLTLGLFLAIPIGAFMEVTLGEKFVFVYAHDYRSALPWVGSVLAAFIAWGLAVSPGGRTVLESMSERRWLRWVLAWPFAVILFTSMIVVAPLGWLALAGRLLGQEAHGEHARVLSIEPYVSRTRGCDQRAQLQIGRTDAELCVARVQMLHAPQPGEWVRVDGLRSPLGFYVQRLRQDPLLR